MGCVIQVSVLIVDDLPLVELVVDLAQGISAPFLAAQGRFTEDMIQDFFDSFRIRVIWVAVRFDEQENRGLVLVVDTRVPRPGLQWRSRVEEHCSLGRLEACLQ